MLFLKIVDVATHEKDPLRRVAFVAAFAMANYSSTIGRIAKPFNPMVVSLFVFLGFALFYIYNEIYLSITYTERNVRIC